MILALDLNPFDLIADPIKFALDHFQQLFAGFPPLQAVGSFGLAIIVTTILLRIILIPIFSWNLRILRRVQAEQLLIAPELQALRKLYKGDPKRLTAEIQKLYQKHHISPFSGARALFPTLVQLPILIGLYSAIHLYTSAGHTNLSFLWIPDLSKSPLSTGLGSHPLLLLIPLLAAGATYLQARMMQALPSTSLTPAEQHRVILSRRILLSIFPAFIFISALNFAQAIGLYWITQSLFLIGQQYRLLGWGQLPVPAWIPGSSRHARLNPNPTPSVLTASPAVAPRPPAPASKTNSPSSKKRRRPKRRR
jgi:YidC/Oxa1 family membrane protein insertase